MSGPYGELMGGKLPIVLKHTPAVKSAKLPAAYESAKTALAKCVRIDECKKWADKAAALASYAKQAADDSLERYAKRIRARAILRAGNLLEAIEPQQGKRTDQLRVSSDPKSSRKEVARAAGMSERQQKQALRIARIPKDEFEKQIESDNPPTISQLEQQGRKPLPFTKKQVSRAKARVHLSGILDRIEQLNNDFEWNDFVALADAVDAIDLTNRSRNAARMFERIAKCIQQPT